MTTPTHSLRRGLPRVPGGLPWPPVEGAVASAADTALAEAAPVAAAAPEGRHAAPDQAVPPVPVQQHPDPTAVETTRSGEPGSGTALGATEPSSPAAGLVLRRGLPRVAGEEPWPPATALGPAPAVLATAPETNAPSPEPEAVTPLAAPAAPVATPVAAAPTSSAAAPAVAAPVPAVASPAQPTTPKQASQEPAAPQRAAAAPDPAPQKRTRIARRAIWGAVGAVAAAGIIVLAARGVTTLPGVPEFLAKYPGEYALPAFVEDGFPAWARWTHFLNFFFMALIVRTGLLVRHQQTPPAFFTPRRGGKKISLNLWLHTSVDLLWMATGVTFVVLLFASGHWARIVPTSWDVFPNAVSAALQYLTLEWPIEDGWVNYNSLQQLMYFTVVFVAAPLAIISGVRMSEWWPKRAERLSRAYPTELARAIHFPVMLFFVLFVIVHVFLVLTTGALKNLGHMFAGVSEPSWVGFWWFAGSVVVTAAVVWAARPLVVAPIAQLFGRVSAR